MGSSWSSKGSGTGIVLQNPSLQPIAGPLNAEFDSTSSIRANMHDLFVMFVTQVREFTLQIAYNAPQTDVAQTQLSCGKTLDDLGASFSNYYGPAAGKQIAQHLKDGLRNTFTFIIQAKRLYIDQKPNCTKQSLNSELVQWNHHCNLLADHLVALNPGLSKDSVITQFAAHIDFTSEEVIAVMEGFNDNSLKSFKNCVNHIRGVADMLALLIIAHVNKGQK